jgi:ABC-2 type transport system permease protein
MNAIRGLGLLFQLRLRLLLRRGLRTYSKNARVAAPIRLLLAALVAVWLVFALAAPIATWLLTSANGSQGRLFLTPVLSSGLSVVSVLIFFYGLLRLGMSLTSKSDLDLLLLTPLSPRVVMSEKVLTVSLTFSALLSLGLPGLIGVDRALHLGPPFIVVGIVTMLLVPIVPVSAALLVALAVLKWFPASSARSIMAVLGTTIAALIYIGSQLLFTPPAIGQTPGAPPSLPNAVPTTWPGHALAAAGLGQPGLALLYLAGSLALAAGLCGLSVTLASYLFVTGGATYQEVRRRHPSSGRNWLSAVAPERHKTRPLPPGIAAVATIAATPFSALVIKDWLSLRRDPQRLAQLAYPLVIVGFYAYRLFMGGSTAFAGSGQRVGGETLYGMLTFTTILLVSSIAPTTVNREGRSLYLLALAPVSSRRILLAKWLSCGVPVAILVEAILLIGSIFIHLSPGRGIVAAFALLALVTALTGLNIMFNLIWPRLSSDGGRQQASVAASLVSMISEFVVGGIVFGLLIAGWALWSQLPWGAVGVTVALFFVAALITAVSATVGSRVFASLLTGERVLG